ncbi:MAG: CRTAC1 family protein [Planctomycetota bacterium]|jgi:hypothetical protein
MRNGVTFIASALLSVLAACGGDEEQAAPTTSFKPRFEPNAAGATKVRAGVAYVDVTAPAGIDFVHENGAKGDKWLPETMGSGVAMLDYDGDGDTDLLFVQSRKWEGPAQPTMRLYRNDGAFKFADVTKEAGLDVACYGMGATVADYDADGDPDFYVTCLGPDMLMRNEGGRFERVQGGPIGGTWAGKGKEEVASWSTGAGWFDADGDGDLDLIVVAYVRWTPEIDIYAQTEEGTKAYIRPQLYDGDRPRLYLQQDDGTFVDGTKGSGFDKTAELGKSLAVCFEDFNRDGKTDVFVANDTVQNFLFLNRGGGKFEEPAIPAAVAYDDAGRARAAMGSDTVDWRNDGRPSIFIGNFSEEPVSLYSVVPRKGTDVLFQDDAAVARIGHPTLLPLTFGLAAIDADLDGWCDVVLSNGHIEPSITKLKGELQYEQAPQLFRNMAGKRFADVSLDAGKPFSSRIVGRGLAAGDLDGDGDLDLVFTSNGGRPLVLRADLSGQHRSLRLRLKQPGRRNIDALGAVVGVTAGGMTQRRMVRTGGSYLSQGELALTFGLGKAARAEKVSITWPDGTVQEAGGLDAGLHVIDRK